MEDKVRNVNLCFSCPEKWEGFEEHNNQKFCDKCQHSVVDFTNASQPQFDQALKVSGSRLCGRFKASQMSKSFLKYAAASAIAASTVGCSEPVDLSTPPPKAAEQSIKIEEEVHFMGIVFISPDAMETESDTTATESAVDEDEYFRDSE